jgi:hypothetical protein
MNDPLVATEAKRFAERAMSEQPASAADRIERMYQLAFGRSATSDELTAAQAFLAHQSQQYGIAVEGSLTDVRPWADLAQVLFNCKEFVFVE